jgi:hypothetical protein
MNIQYLAPLILASCIEYLRKRDVNTKYHPKQDEFFLDSKTIARIIRYNGDLRATISNEEATFFGKVITTLVAEETVESPLRKESYSVRENNDFQRKAINVSINKWTLPFRGRPIRSEQHESVLG